MKKHNYFVKLAALALALVLTLSLTACGGGSSDNDGDTQRHHQRGPRAAASAGERHY